MRLAVHRKDTKLFFVTFTVAGRRRILSRLIDERHRPELTALGEPAILGSSFLFHVRLTLKKTVPSRRATILRPKIRANWPPGGC